MRPSFPLLREAGSKREKNLETTTDLSSNDWVAVTDAVTVVGDSFVLTNRASADHAFFRLHGH